MKRKIHFRKRLWYKLIVWAYGIPVALLIILFLSLIPSKPKGHDPLVDRWCGYIVDEESRDFGHMKFEDCINVVNVAYKKDSSPTFSPLDMVTLAWIESDFNPNELGKHGEVGAWQILDWSGALNILGTPHANPYSLDVNMAMAVITLDEKYSIHKDFKRSIVAYNGVYYEDGKLVETYWKRFKKYQSKLARLRSRAEEELSAPTSSLKGQLKGP